MFDYINNKEFVEKLHPRGSDGKFTEKIIFDRGFIDKNKDKTKKSNLFFDMYDDRNVKKEKEDKDDENGI
ncbi:MAG: hypothetical protein LBG48_03700 [Rickettsiales bacterium]|jgi:hypothetical protein|nr:hypothetical protein [Rickettsiales bacterium]